MNHQLKPVVDETGAELKLNEVPLFKLRYGNQEMLQSRFFIACYFASHLQLGDYKTRLTNVIEKLQELANQSNSLEEFKQEVLYSCSILQELTQENDESHLINLACVYFLLEDEPTLEFNNEFLEYKHHLIKTSEHKNYLIELALQEHNKLQEHLSTRLIELGGDDESKKEQDVYEMITRFEFAERFQHDYYDTLVSITDGDVLKIKELQSLTVEEFALTLNSLIKRSKSLNEPKEKQEDE